MKKLLLIAGAAFCMAACNNGASKTESTGTDSASMTADTSTAKTPAASDTAATANSSAAVKDGMMKMQGGKMIVMKDGAWSPMQESMTCTNGCKVMPNGEVTKAGKKKMLTEGMMIDKDGQIMDADGKLVDESAWK